MNVAKAYWRKEVETTCCSAAAAGRSWAPARRAAGAACSSACRGARWCTACRPLLNNMKLITLPVEAARVVVVRPRVGVDVLLVVEEHDGPQREEGRHETDHAPHVKARLPTVQSDGEGAQRDV